MNGLINFIFRRFSCEKCNGCGLIKKSEAKSCGCDGTHFCYKCENSFKMDFILNVTYAMELEKK